MEEKLNRSVLLKVLLLMGLAAISIFCGCATQRPLQPIANSVAEAPPVDAPVVLAAGDVIRLIFPGAPELNQTQKIRTDGRISLPMVGEINAAGKRPLELQNELKGLYEPKLQNSEVVVALESGAVPVFLSGAVRRPGRIVFDRPANLLEVITEAGGFTPQANIRKVRVIRLVNGQHHTQVVDLKPALSGRTAQAFYVRPNDVIHVGENFLNF